MTVYEALDQLARAVPDHRAALKASLKDTLLTECEVFYEALRRAFPKQVYAPHVISQRKLLPPFISIEQFDKGTKVANFARVHLRKILQSTTFLHTPRFTEVAGLRTTSDGKFLLYWRLIDGFALGTVGVYNRFSQIMQRSPLPADRVIALLANYREHRPGRGAAARVHKPQQSRSSFAVTEMH